MFLIINAVLCNNIFCFQIHFGCVIGRYYPAFNFLGQCCCTGMSYLFKKSVLEDCMPTGLIYFGKYLAEDFFLCTLLHEK